MRVLIERGDGAIVEAREVEGVPPNTETLIFFTKISMRRDDLKDLEKRLSEKTGKTCVILDHFLEKVVGV